MLNIKELEESIVKHAQLYYSGKQVISDDEFDKMVDTLRELQPDSAVLQQVGWGYAVDEKSKIRHTGNIVGSLEKVKYPEEPSIAYDVVITPKLDGSTVVLYYHQGTLIQAITRGDGINGMSCLNKMRYLLRGIQVPITDGIISIRGEAIIPATYHDELKKRGIPNPRNYANGILNRIEAGEDIDMVRFIPYSVRVYGENDLNKTDMLGMLQKWGFKKCPYIYCKKVESVNDLQTLFDKWSETYPLDGLVLTQHKVVHVPMQCEMEGVSDSSAYSINEIAIAYKFQSERAQIEVGALEWQVGETGRLTPMIRVKNPVFLSGATISNVMAHNATQVIERGIGAGAICTIERANEVIPYLVSVDEPVDAVLPTRCPECGNDVVWKNMDLVCTNNSCPSRQFAIIKSILEVCGIPEGLGDSMLLTWIDHRDVIDIIEHGNNSTQYSCPAYSDPESHYTKLIVQLWYNIRDKFAKGFTYTEFWSMIRIPGLGNSHARTLGEVDPKQATMDSFAMLPSNVVTSIQEKVEYWTGLAAKIPFADQPHGAAIALKVAVTGKLSMPRKEFEKLLATKNIILGSVGKDTTYLICNESSDSSKAKKAQSLGTKVVTEVEFMALVKDM